ncbi:MAG TPA: bifunctional riboflavin kinase/FAD synthetase [Burkholderiales bacterium]|nr:bifunctional riboflavin kinase/FAD synthetase [Burkholderiales bacterium]
MLITRGLGRKLVVTRGLAPRGGGAGAAALTIGNFDGVHNGHQAMLARLAATARARGISATVLTFEPHPREFFAPQSAPTRLTNLREKLELLAAHGVDRVHVQRFSAAFAALSPEAFVERMVVGALGARWVLVGDDFRFGAKRAGDFASLADAARRHGFDLEAMPTVSNGGVRVSSSAVRDALARGDLARAHALLGRPYSISGRVVHGEKLGRGLGFATANVQLKHNRPPLGGIFAVRVHGIGAAPRQGVASLGVRPTVKAGGKAVLEVHLFDFAGDLYGAHLRVEFLAKLRDEEKYSDLDALKAQIARDCAAARDVLKALENA